MDDFNEFKDVESCKIIIKKSYLLCVIDYDKRATIKMGKFHAIRW